MPKPRRKAQRQRAKLKKLERAVYLKKLADEKPEYLKKVSYEKLISKPDLKINYDHRDATPFNCSLLVRSLADEKGGGLIYG